MRRRTAAAQRYHNRAGAGTGWALEQKSTAGAGLKFRLSQNAVPSFGALPAVAIGFKAPDRWTLNATALTNCRRNSKPLHASVVSQFGFKPRHYPCVAFCGEIARARCAAASERRSQPWYARGRRRRSRGDRSRVAARPPFSPPGSAADFPSRPAAPSADQAAPAAAASDWRLPETASRARHRVVRRGRVSRCTS